MTKTLQKQLSCLAVFGFALGALGAGAQTSRAQDNPFDFLGIFGRARENAKRSICQSNLKQVALGYIQYSQDWDEKMPPARKWNDVLLPYLKSAEVFDCPSLAKGKTNGYALNAKTSGKSLEVFAAPAQTVAVYETWTLKPNAFGMGENGVYRHLGGANYAYADGHVKWLLKGTVPSFKLKP